ncbi:MAG: nucleoside deaminase [Ignavibacteria bacterium]|nr:nucleoside deaminase [Ignavibacteria bacterium]
MITDSHKLWMNFALKESVIAYDNGEVPVGCVIIYNNKLIAKTHNQVEKLKDPTAHAEILAITSAANYLGKKFLENCLMYVTLEPCSMCSGAIVHARISHLYFGCYDIKAGACGSVMNIPESDKLNHKVKVFGGIMDAECSQLLKEFFLKKR